ncbi:MAG TPA: proton-conducting transporter membrane subunit, partial [Candidatus Xenobia bacterium]
ALLGVAALQALLLPEATWQVPAPFTVGGIPLLFHRDALAGWFLFLLGVASLGVSLSVSDYLAHLDKRVDIRMAWITLPLLLASMALVTLAANAVTFLVSWELMSLTSFVLVATDHHSRQTRRAALIYGAATRIGTALLFIGLLWTHSQTGSWNFADWHLAGAAALGPGLLILAALGIKAGLWPFHLWLPVAHPAAPAPVSALMSGVMLKIAVYMMARLFIVGRAFDFPALPLLLLGVGSISAFWGVCFALLQQDLKRLLAYSSIENVGLIVMGLGASALAQRLGFPELARLGLAAALLHALNHALFKSLLFLSAGAADAGAHTRDLELLGGLARTMPVTFACFVIGSAAVCGLPPLNGFASEWLLYQTGLGLAVHARSPALRFAALLGIGWLALVGALALACFVKATGITFLGRPRSHQAEHSHPAPPGLQAAQRVLAGLCIAAGLAPPLLLQAMQPAVDQFSFTTTPLANWWTVPVGPLVLVLALTIAALQGLLYRFRHAHPVHPYRTWECGFGDLTTRMQATATSFVQPIGRMFGVLFHYAIVLHIDGPNRHLFPQSISVEPRTESFLATRVYRPLWRLLVKLGDQLVHLQTGSMHLYLLTMLITLVILLALGAYSL